MWEQRATRILKTAGLAEATGANIFRLLKSEFYRNQAKKIKNSTPLKKPRKKH